MVIVQAKMIRATGMNYSVFFLGVALSTRRAQLHVAELPLKSVLVKARMRKVMLEEAEEMTRQKMKAGMMTEIDT